MYWVRVKILYRQVDKEKVAMVTEMRQKQQKSERGAEHDRGSSNLPAPELSALGFNDNMNFMGRELHIQTENTGSPARGIVTQVFFNGRVLYSTRSEYPPDVCESQDFKQIQDLMRAQHLRVINKIRAKKTEILGQS